jgi:hypothetical protein
MLFHNILLAVRIPRDESAALRKVEALLGPSCDCGNAVLRISDPRTSGYRLLSGGIHRLPAASSLVSARLGIDGALSLRYLCSWNFLLSTNLLLLLPRSLPAPTSVDSRYTPGPSPAISASRLVVVKMRSCLHRRRRFFNCCAAGQRASPADAGGGHQGQPCSAVSEPDLQIRRRRI